MRALFVPELTGKIYFENLKNLLDGFAESLK